VHAKHPLLKKRKKTRAASLAPSTAKAVPGQIHFGFTKKIRATLQPNAFFWCDARMMLPVEENDCSDKSNPLGKVSSRAGETTFFKALENSKRVNCRLVETKHLLLSSLEYKFSV
jgi:hypothetical protein